MTTYNGYTFTNLSGGDTQSDPDSFTNPGNAFDDNESTYAQKTSVSTGAQGTKTLGTTFTSQSTKVIFIKFVVDLGLGSASYDSQVDLEAYNGSSWIKVLTLQNSTSQTNTFTGIFSGTWVSQGLRVSFKSTVDNGNTIDLKLYTLSYGTSFTYVAKMLLELLGGNNLEDLGDLTAIAEDHTLTWTTIYKASSGIAMGYYRTLQSNNIFENGDLGCADEFTDANGTNNTVDTVNTTARYLDSNDSYTLNYTDEASGDTTSSFADKGSWVNTGNAFDNNDSTFAENAIGVADTGSKDGGLGKTFSSKYVGWIKIKATGTISGGQGSSLKLQTYNGSVWSSIATLDAGTADASSFDGFYYLNATTQGIRVFFDYAGTANATFSSKLYSLEYGDFDLTNFVQCDTGTLTLNGNERAAIVYFDVDLPTNTSIRADIGDGGTPVTGLIAVNKISFVEITSLGSGTLDLRAVLITTDDEVTPELRGYGVLLVY